MIKYLSPSQLHLAQKKFYYKYHNHKDETVFMASPSPDFLNPRAYNLCELCGRLKSVEMDKTMKKEIQEIIAKKKLAAIN